MNEVLTEELEVLASIYGDENVVVTTTSSTHTVLTINLTCESPTSVKVYSCNVRFYLPSRYPEESPTFEVSYGGSTARLTSHQQKIKLEVVDKVQQQLDQDIGNAALFQACEIVRESLNSISGCKDEEDDVGCGVGVTQSVFSSLSAMASYNDPKDDIKCGGGMKEVSGKHVNDNKRMGDALDHINSGEETRMMNNNINNNHNNDEYNDNDDCGGGCQNNNDNCGHASQSSHIQVFHGDITVEKKSSFMAHLACVSSMKDVEDFMNIVLSDKKVAHATHNISAYRFTCPNTGILFHDCDDDGETAAGARLGELLRLMKIDGVAVVVSRWFGGTLLGPDRFKFITNAARQLIEQHMHVIQNQKSNTSNSKKKK